MVDLATGLDVLLYDGDSWGYASSGVDFSRDPCVHVSPGTGYYACVIGEPVTRHYYIDDDGNPVEAGLGETPSNKKPLAITLLNTWSRIDECVKILVCDQRLSKALAKENAKSPLDEKPIVITNIGRHEKYYASDYRVEVQSASEDRAIPEGAEDDAYDLRFISLNRVVAL
jgi:hypothetical protein